MPQWCPSSAIVFLYGLVKYTGLTGLFLFLPQHHSALTSLRITQPSGSSLAQQGWVGPVSRPWAWVNADIL